MQVYSILTVIISLIESSFAANFLVYCPLFAHSHHKFLANIAETLTIAGHNVTFLAPIIARKYESVKYLEHTKDVVYIQPDQELEQLGERMDSADFSKFWTEDPDMFSMVPTMQLFRKMFYKVYENIRDDLSVLDALKNRDFDAIIYEVLSFNAIAIREYLKIPTLYPAFSITHHVQLSRTIGEPTLPSTISSPLLPFGEKMAFKERLTNTLFEMALRMLSEPPAMMSYSYPHNIIDVREIESRATFVFLNSNPFLDFPRPTLTKTVPIGGISVNLTQIKEEKLPGEYNEILSERKKNVMISFGSVMYSKDMPESYRSCIIKVIEQHPEVTFIWKYESEDVSFAGNLTNLHFLKWVPQTALLADPRLSAFVTHAGLGSVNELSYSGKPAVLVPIFADQLRNAKMLARHNGSIYLDKHDLGNFYNLDEAVKSVLYDESYSKNAKNLARQLSEQPISPQQLLVRYAEFGAKFGELSSLDPYSRQMSFFTLYLIDIFAFLEFILVVSTLICVVLLRALLRTLLRKKEKSE